MKIAVYTICKNEAHFVDRFMENLKEADGVYVTDTGSSDDTVEKLRAAGAIVNQIKVDPWRFDVARNISLDFVPGDVDVCFCLDLDEVVTPGWHDAIEKAYKGDVVNPFKIDRLRYKYVWNHLEDGKDGTTFWYDKIHLRRGFRWVKPVHEVLNFYPNPQERQGYSNDFVLHHWPDNTKSRGSYLGLLEIGVKEQPNDDRNCHYLGREYMYYREYDKSIAELKRHLALPNAKWEPERAASMRYIGRCYLAKGDPAEAMRWFFRAGAESPGEREPWVELGRAYERMGDHLGVYQSMKKALSIKERPATYICDPESWGPDPYDLAGTAAYYLGLYQEAHDLTEEAIKLAPKDARLKQNLHFAKQKLELTIPKVST